MRSLRPIDERWGPHLDTILDGDVVARLLQRLAEWAGLESNLDDDFDSLVIRIGPADRFFEYVELLDVAAAAPCLAEDDLIVGEASAIARQLDELQAMLPAWRAFQATCTEDYFALRIDC